MSGFITGAGNYLPILMEGVVLTLVVTLFSVVLSTVLGFAWAIMMWSRIPLLAGFARTFITVIRGIPIIVQLFYIYFVMPDIGLNLTAVQAGIIGLGIAYSAYQAENFRAGIEAIDRGQIEAAHSIGMTDGLVMRRVIMPQAVRIVLPPFGNTIIMMLKDFLARLDHHGGRADTAGPAYRGLDLRQHDGVHAGRSDLPGAEPAANFPDPPS